jgi:hypothetical protein
MVRNTKLIVFLCLAALACGGLEPVPTATPIPTRPPAPTAEPLSGTPVNVPMTVPNQFAAYEPMSVDGRVDAPVYDVDLAAVTNSNVLQLLNERQRATLAKNGFVVAPEEGWQQIYEIYQATDRSGQPVFVTTDALLHTFHVLYDFALRRVEIDYLVADLQALNAGMVAASLAQLQEAEGGPAEQAAWRNVAFFSVGGRLLDPEFEVPDTVGDIVEDELTLIEQAGGIFTSPLFGIDEDYSQYKPRGHYTRNETFGRYFRAMMWYGRMPFTLHSLDENVVRQATRQALLIIQALNSSNNLSRWERIYLPTTFFVGVADDLTVYDYQAVAQAVYGGLPGPVDLADQAQLDSFIASARNLPRPQILSQPVISEEGVDAVAASQSFRFMGQRFIPDSAIMQELVFNRVGLYTGDTAGTLPFTAVATNIGLIRGFPRGLDVAATLGSERALAILQAGGDTSYEGYDGQMATLRANFAGLDEATWTQNLYWGWLYSLQPLLVPPPEGAPVFMANQAWQDRQLNSWFGSWAELRHDTILYAKQSFTEGAGAAPPTDEPRGYVEPQPAVYARLAALARQMNSGLSAWGLLDKETGEKLLRLENLLLSLQTISEKELRGEALTDNEYDLIRYIGNSLETLTTFSAETEDELASEVDERMAIIADVHTDVNSGQVLEVGVGDAWPIYVVVLVDGEQVVTVGGVFSSYEFKQPLGNRLTDEEWQAMSPKPERPAWTDSFIVP